MLKILKSIRPRRLLTPRILKQPAHQQRRVPNGALQAMLLLPNPRLNERVPESLLLTSLLLANLLQRQLLHPYLNVPKSAPPPPHPLLHLKPLLKRRLITLAFPHQPVIVPAGEVLML